MIKAVKSSRKRRRTMQLEEEEEELLISGKERIVKYFSSGPIWDSGLCLVCVKGASDGPRILINGTPNVGRNFFGVSEIDLRGVPVFPNPDDKLHIIQYKYGYCKRICPFGGENGRPKGIYSQSQPCLYNAEYDYTILLIAVIDLFGPLTKETLAHVKGPINDFCALIEASNDCGIKGRESWAELYEYKGWKRDLDHAADLTNNNDSLAAAKKQEQNEQTRCTVSSYDTLTAHIQKAKIQAVMTQARLFDLRSLQRNPNISIMDVLPSSAVSADFHTVDFDENTYIAELLLSLSRT